MSWLRIDDGFTNHPKIVELNDAEFRVWMRLLCYCSRVQDPTVDAATRREVAGLTPKRVKRFSKLGLIDDDVIHDWAHYRPKDETNAERQRRWRTRQKADRIVTDSVTEPVTETVTPPARAHKPEPVPAPEQAKEEKGNGSSNGHDEGLPFDKQLQVSRMLAGVNNADVDTASVIQALAMPLPLSSLVKVRESVERHGKVGAGYVVNALKSERSEAMS